MKISMKILVMLLVMSGLIGFNASAQITTVYKNLKSDAPLKNLPQTNIKVLKNTINDRLVIRSRNPLNLNVYGDLQTSPLSRLLGLMIAILQSPVNPRLTDDIFIIARPVNLKNTSKNFNINADKSAANQKGF
jgi:hypothetical protein